MGSYLRSSMSAIRRELMISICLILFLLITPFGYGQEEDLFGSAEDDSLLFGEEFDLGGDDFSFEADEETPAGDDAATEDDFFGDFDEEDEAALSEEEPAAEEDDWGFGEDLFAADSTADTTFTEAYTDHPLDFRKSTNGTFMEGTGITFSLYSPQRVNDKLKTWHSHLDYSLSVELPWHYAFDPVEVSFLVDVSSFNFKNSFPAGGTFNGASFMPYIRAEAGGLEVEAGAGMFYPSFGLMAGLGYSIQIHSIFLSTGYRWNWAANIDPIGAAWWLEPRFTLGVRLW